MKTLIVILAWCLNIYVIAYRLDGFFRKHSNRKVSVASWNPCVACVASFPSWCSCSRSWGVQSSPPSSSATEGSDVASDHVTPINVIVVADLLGPHQVQRAGRA
jgi:hypothetical protein